MAKQEDVIRRVAAHQAGATIHPIGAFCMFTVSTNPNTLLGYGTWLAMDNNPVFTMMNTDGDDVDIYCWQRTA